MEKLDARISDLLQEIADEDQRKREALKQEEDEKKQASELFNKAKDILARSGSSYRSEPAIGKFDGKYAEFRVRKEFDESTVLVSGYSIDCVLKNGGEDEKLSLYSIFDTHVNDRDGEKTGFKGISTANIILQFIEESTESGKRSPR